MSDRSLTLQEFAETYLGGKSTKTAKRRVITDHIPYHLDHGHMLILQSDAEIWRDARTITPAALDLKTMLREISERELKKMKHDVKEKARHDRSGNRDPQLSRCDS